MTAFVCLIASLFLLFFRSYNLAYCMPYGAVDELFDKMPRYR